jgi:hypothetical protein
MVSNRSAVGKESIATSFISWAERSKCCARAHSFSQSDEAMLSMQHKVLIRLHHIVCSLE